MSTGPTCTVCVSNASSSGRLLLQLLQQSLTPDGTLRLSINCNKFVPARQACDAVAPTPLPDMLDDEVHVALQLLLLYLCLRVFLRVAFIFSNSCSCLCFLGRYRKS